MSLVWMIRGDVLILQGKGWGVRSEMLYLR